METLKNRLARRSILAAFIFSFNVALTAYINSSFLSNYFSAQMVGVIFSLASLSTLIILEFSPRILERLGVRRTTSIFLFINLLMISMLATATQGIFIALALIFYIATNNIILYNIDIIIAHFANQSHVGEIRGLYLTITNLAWLMSPFLAGVVVQIFGAPVLYSIASLTIAPALLIILFGIKKFQDTKYHDRSLFASFQFIHSHKDISLIILSFFLLQVFYAWMVIYTPLYLIKEKGFEFGDIGIIFTIMLLPFVLLELPLGRLADKKLGEKELLVFGFIIMACAVFLFGTYTGNSLLYIAILLFFSRVGAATVEVMSNTYFFKCIDDREPFLISLFRNMTPAAYLIAPVVATLIISLFGFLGLYITLGIVLVFGAAIALKIHDTR